MGKQFKNPGDYKQGDILIAAEEIDQRLDELITQLVEEYKNKRVLLVGLLTGAAWVTVDLLNRLHENGVTDADLSFLKVSSYRKGDKVTQPPRIKDDVLLNPRGRHVLLVDDISDTGSTLLAVTELLQEKKIATVRSFVLVDKPSRREVHFKPDYIGFTIPNIWIQGRGMDSDGYGRGDPNIRKGPYR